MSTAPQSLPGWILPDLYGDADQDVLHSAITTLRSELESLKQEIMEWHTNTHVSLPAHDVSDAFERLADRYNELLTDHQNLLGFLSCRLTINARDEVALGLYSQLQRVTGLLSDVGRQWAAWLATLDLDTLAATSSIIDDYHSIIKAAQDRTRYHLPDDIERVVNELVVTGSGAWAKLHAQILSQMTVTVPGTDERHTLSDGVLNAMLYGPDRTLRHAAYVALVEGFDAVALPLAAAINSIKGEALTVAKYRGFESVLDAALFDSQISRDAFEAMFTAVRASLSEFQRYLSQKARILQVPQVGFYDLLAPIIPPTEAWSFAQAQQQVVRQFNRFSAEGGAFAERAFAEQWIDAQPRTNKRPGASCTVFGMSDSRISMNFRPGLGSVLTLAHELGHAFHYHCLARRPMLMRQPPLVLAETGSLFFETLVSTGLVENSPLNARAESLNAFLESGITSIVDVAGRVLFEERLFTARQERELSIEELKALNVETYAQVYGDILNPSTTFPYAWAFLPQYYEQSFYNFPYLFGQLFSLGLYTSFCHDPERIAPVFERLLDIIRKQYTNRGSG